MTGAAEHGLADQAAQLASLPLFSLEWHQCLYALPWPQECPQAYSRGLWQEISRCKESFVHWQGSVDVFDGHWLAGWIRNPDSDAPQTVAIYVNDQLLAENYSAGELREDVRAAGFSSGACGYVLAVPFLDYGVPPHPWVKVVLTGGNGSIVAFRFFPLAESLAADLHHVVAVDLTRRKLAAASLPLWKLAVEQSEDRGMMQSALQAAQSCNDKSYIELFSRKIKAHADRHTVRAARAKRPAK